MQGRLSPLVDGKIQAFPWESWQHEFPLAQSLGLGLMEWTLDHDRLYQNPLLMSQGQQEIRRLCEAHELSIPSLTGDCFMQAPFWKSSGQDRAALEADFIAIARACAEVGIQMIVVPLVDNGRLENEQQEEALLAFMLTQADLFRALGLRIIFESDFAPSELARFIGRLPADAFGVNYDIGNSAALGYNPSEEFAAYGSRIVNVHVKDRALGGTTVPLGTGNADFPTVFRLLREVAYTGYLIMQTARARDDDHAGALRHYMAQIEAWSKGA
ncbi:sugar phosphate isomerase/epimerase [Cyanobium sp. Lug-B]|uniref:sugar phosphate isomerase/epimerase family protein n=1 Tax=Cyanobium sp. Lug-B TaxID=2823716 RepID=UPI0020CED461|nr:sugar phosphate isomerase/epimerase family protein [Cyanobium sp. Lug-B]MCP9796849.1 sugar phosphate isomerase/epimerase [Cyanobium sp. Lug-B]